MTVTVTPLGPEISVNTLIYGEQTDPVITALANGGFVVTWASYIDSTSSIIDIRAQVYSPAGQPIGGEFTVNANTDLFQDYPTIAVLANGGFVVCWEDYSGTLGDSSGRSIKAQVFSALGTPIGGELLVNTQTSGDQSRPVVTELADGGFVVSWIDGNDVKAQIFDATGMRSGGEFSINVPDEFLQWRCDMTALPAGGFVITWEDTSPNSDGNGSSIKAMIFSGTGSVVRQEFVVNTDTLGNQRLPNICTLANGRFVISWEARPVFDGDLPVSLAQVFEADGTKVGGEIFLGFAPISHNSNTQVTGLPSGGFVVTRQVLIENGVVSATGSPEIYARLYSENGQPIGDEFRVNADIDGSQLNPRIDTLANGDFVITWQSFDGGSDSWEIRAQVFSVNAPNAAPEITSDGGANTAAISIGEGAEVVTTVTASDPDATAVLNYSIAGGADQGLFSIDPQTGVLRFLLPPDFENPADQDGDNVYDVIVRVSDGIAQDDQEMEVTVTDRDSAIFFLPTSDEFLVNTSTFERQDHAAVTQLAGGGFVICWQDRGPTPGDTSVASVKAQIFDATGTPVGGEFRVNTLASGYQGDPAVLALEDGGFVVAYASQTTSDIALQRFSATGQKVGGEVTATDSSNGLEEIGVTITALSNGGYVVTWLDGSYTNGYATHNIRGQIFDDSGIKVGNNFLIENNIARLSGEISTINYNSVVATTAGGFAVVWSYNDGSYDLRAPTNTLISLFDQSGQEIGIPRELGRVCAIPFSTSEFGTIAVLLGSNLTSAPVYQIQYFDAAGAAFGNPITLDIDASAGWPETIVSLPGGGFATVGTVPGGPLIEGRGPTVMLQLFEADGSRRGGAFQVNTAYSDGGLLKPILAVLESGDLVVTWEDTTPGLLDPDQSLRARVISIADSGAPATLSLAENQTEVRTIGAGLTDDSQQPIVYSIAGGDDAASFMIDEVTGALRFRQPPDHEAPEDADGDNVYMVMIEASDGNTSYFQVLNVTVTNVSGSFRGTGAADILNGTTEEDTLLGVGGNDSLSGFLGNDVLDGGLGADVLAGGAGNDTYIVDSSGDTVTENPGEGEDTVRSQVNFTLGANFENLILTGSAAINGTGNAAANVMVGGSGANVLDGQGGADRMSGGKGNDTYVVDDTGDIVTEGPGEGTDLVRAGISYTLGEYIENLTLLGGANINAIGNALDNALTGNGGANQLDGRAGSDTMLGGAGNDVYFVDSAGDRVFETTTTAGANTTDAGGTDTVVSAVSFSLNATNGVRFVEILQLLGSSHIDATGNALANQLFGNTGNNRLDGGTGADYMFGYLGDDTYIVDSAGDFADEGNGGGIDTVVSSISYALGMGMENLTLSGNLAINGTGNAFANTLTGNGLANVLDGMAGNDTMLGGGGNDIYIVGSANDRVFETFTTSANDIVDVGGNDRVLSSVTFNLDATNGVRFVEHLTLTGSAAINGTGNALANTLTGNDAVNILSGGLGGDTLDGAGGNDRLLGGDNDDIVRGGSGDDTLDGGAGADSMAGGAGNDSYVVDSIGDRIFETATTSPTDTIDAGGDDRVSSSITFSLGTLNGLKFVERLILTGTADIDGIGNALANRINGNDGANRLDGGLGADILDGGLGNDTYLIDDAGDVVIEAGSAGTDTVLSRVSASLSANVENLTLTGNGIINATGNTLANTLTGNAAANVLDGRAGNDTMLGGAGSDTYVVDAVGDRVFETATTNAADIADAGGVDSVLSSVAFNLALTNGVRFVERLTLTGTAAINGTGNDLANTLTGNEAANTLAGGLGADTLDGAGGNDRLVGGEGDDAMVGGLGDDFMQGGAGRDQMSGGLGADSFAFADGETSGVTASTCDRIMDFSQAEGDRLRLNLMDANTANGASTNEAFTFIATGAFSGVAGQLRYQVIGSNTIVQGDLNGDAVADFWLRVDGVHALAAGDFVV